MVHIFVRHKKFLPVAPTACGKGCKSATKDGEERQNPPNVSRIEAFPAVLTRGSKHEIAKSGLQDKRLKGRNCRAACEYNTENRNKLDEPFEASVTDSTAPRRHSTPTTRRKILMNCLFRSAGGVTP